MFKNLITKIVKAEIHNSIKVLCKDMNLFTDELHHLNIKVNSLIGANQKEESSRFKINKPLTLNGNKSIPFKLEVNKRASRIKDVTTQNYRLTVILDTFKVKENRIFECFPKEIVNKTKNCFTEGTLKNSCLFKRELPGKTFSSHRIRNKKGKITHIQITRTS